MRTIPVELAKRYVDEGWWTQDTLGDLIAARTAKEPRRRLRRALDGATVRRHFP